MSNIQISVQGQELTATPDKLLISRSVGEVAFTAEFDSSWDDYTITIIFATLHIQKSVLYTGGQMDVPWEVLARPTDSLRISAVGIKGGHRRPTAHMRNGLAVVHNGAIEGGPPQEYSPALWEQVMAKLDGMGTGGGGGGSSAGAEAAQAKAEAAQKKAEEAQAAAETAAQTAAQEATKAAEEASNAAKFAGSATESAEAAQDAQSKAEKAKEGAEEAKGAAEAILESIPTPKPTGADDGKVPVARGGAYQLEEIAAGSGGELEYIGEYTLAEDVGVWEITSDLNGAPLQLKKMYFELHIQPAQVNIDNNISNTHARMTVPTWTNAYGVNTCVSDYPMLRKTAYKENPGWGQLWEIRTLNGRDVVFRRSKGASCTATVSAGEAAGPGYITGLGLSSLEPTKAQFGVGSTVKIWGMKT